MARRPVLGGGSLNPFGGGGVDFGAFDILNAGNETYLAFLKVETQWNAGKATNDEYLAALTKYADLQDPGTSDYVSLHARLEAAKYQVARNVLLSRIDNRSAKVADLVAFDKAKLVGLNHDSEEYVQRLDLYRQSQARLVSDEEKKQVDLYQAGKLTTTALRAWYQKVLSGSGSVVDDNPDLAQSLKDRIKELAGRVQDEKDSKMLSDFQDGKVKTTDFIAYATSAMSRYAAGTQQANDWKQRITAARENTAETALLYRYNLSQQYAELERFVKGNSGGSKGRTSTSTSHSTRVVLGSDGHWHTVTTTSTKTHAVKPSASEIAAHAKLQIEIADAKRQMGQIARKISGVGGFVASGSMMKFYQGQLGKLARGSDAWYAVQGKIDNLNDRIHQESVFAQQGIRITYPGGASGGGSSSGGTVHAASGGGGHSGGGGGQGPMVPHPSGAGAGGGYSLNQFMRAIATQESGGRYDARNASSGAYGKYQIMPANWSSWARQAGLSANAPQTPQNQERVATAAFQRLAKAYHNDWSRVAAAWFAGVAGSSGGWGPRTVRYVAAIMSHMGTTIAAVRGGGGSPVSSMVHGPAGGGPVASYSPGGSVASYSPKPGMAPSHSAAAVHHGTAQQPATGHGPLSQIISVGAVRSRGGSHEIVNTRSMGFPANLDGRAFEHFYANYEHAFESGAESFVDSSSGKAIHYFIGSDPAERIDRMRQLDDLRVQLFDTRAIAYQGTAGELTAQNKRDNAVQDVARHEYMIVDSGSATDKGSAGSAKLKAQTNPLASGVRLLDKTEAAIKADLAMAEAAYRRGDITGAYSLFQQAQQLAQANGQTMAQIAGYVSSTDRAIAGITAATGGIGPDEALGTEKGGAFSADLERIHGFDKEIAGLFTAGTSSQTLHDLISHIKLDAAKNPIWDSTADDPLAQLQLTDESYFHLTAAGDIKIESRPPSYNGAKGTLGPNDPKQVTVRVKSGTSVLNAQADYAIENVGSFKDAAGNLFPIMGKVVHYKGADGKWTTFYENPLKPGDAKAGWSNTPWVFATPAGFASIADGKGGTIYTFTVNSGRTNRAGGAITDGWTYKLVLDPATGVYQIAGDKAGGLFEPAQTDVYKGTMGKEDATLILDAAGFVRQGSGFDYSLPVFGMSEADNTAYDKAFQPPMLASVSSIYTDERPGRNAPASAAGAPGAYRPSSNEMAGFGGSPAASAGRNLLGGSPAATAGRNLLGTGGAPSFGSDIAAAVAGRAGLGAVPGIGTGGLSPTERDELHARAALPKSNAPGFVRGQQAATRKVLPPIKPPPRSIGSPAAIAGRNAAATRKAEAEAAKKAAAARSRISAQHRAASEGRNKVRVPLPKAKPPPVAKAPKRTAI